MTPKPTPRDEYNLQVEINFTLLDKLIQAKKAYYKAKVDYENSCYLSKKLDSNVITGARDWYEETIKENEIKYPA